MIRREGDRMKWANRETKQINIYKIAMDAIPINLINDYYWVFIQYSVNK